MRRLFPFLAVCALLCSMDIVCHAREAAFTGEKRQESFGIYATYAAGGTENYTAPVRDGSSTIELPDGTVITASNIPEGALTLVIYPIPEADTDAWNWVKGCINRAGSRLAPYEVYFLDQDGNRIPADGATVTIALANPMENPAVFSLGTDGTVTFLSAQKEGGKIAFTANISRYYVLVEKGEETPSSPDRPGRTADDQPNPNHSARRLNSPNTGDGTDMAGWLAAMALSGGCLAFFIWMEKRGRREVN